MWFVNMFHVQVFLFELLLCRNAEKRRFFWPRFSLLTVIYLILPYLIPGGYFARFFALGWFTFGFMFFIVLSGLVMFSCFRLSWKETVFFCCIAHTLQHLVHCLAHVAKMALAMNSIAAQLTEFLFLLLACAFVIYYFERRFKENDSIDFNNVFMLIFTAGSTLLIYVLSFWTTLRETETIGVMAFDAMSCLLLLVIVMDVFKIRKAEKEQLLLSQLLQKEHEQHQMSLETVEVINRKCHDLRHQITALRTMNAEDKEKSLKDLEHEVMIYDHFPKSGNKDLDILLAEKSLLAEEKGISIRYMIDGNRLRFLQLEDLFALLGNGLDNAIEATTLEPDEEKRIISMTSSVKGNLLRLHIDNPCAVCPTFVDGLPLTSKKDSDWHGFGMRSMQFRCEKYGGVLSTSWEDGVFAVDMVLPMPVTEEK